MQQNTTTTATAPVVDNKKPNDVRKWIIITAVACLVAVCGIGLGIYGMVQSTQKDAQISDLRNKIARDDKNTTQLDSREEEEEQEEKEDKEEEKEKEEEKGEEKADNPNKPVSRFEYEDKIDALDMDIPLVSDRYLGISELGIKVKLPNISNNITYKKYVSEVGNVFYELYSDGEPVNLSVFQIPKSAGAVPDTTIYRNTIGDNTYAIALDNYEAELQPPLSTLIYFFRNADGVIVKL